MMRSIVYVIALFLFLQLSGCKKEDPNPELLDPIFKDLDKRASDYQKSLDEEIKHQAEIRVALEKAEPNTLDFKNARRDMKKSLTLSLDFEQKGRYFQIRAKRRLFTDRIAYKAAFAKNEPWPDPREYSDYQVNMRLQDVPRNWNTRVPKLQDRIANARKPAAEKENPKEE